jgi:hypothetical protein
MMRSHIFSMALSRSLVTTTIAPCCANVSSKLPRFGTQKGCTLATPLSKIDFRQLRYICSDTARAFSADDGEGHDCEECIRRGVYVTVASVVHLA